MIYVGLYLLCGMLTSVLLVVIASLTERHDLPVAVIIFTFWPIALLCTILYYLALPAVKIGIFIKNRLAK